VSREMMADGRRAHAGVDSDKQDADARLDAVTEPHVCRVLPPLHAPSMMRRRIRISQTMDTPLPVRVDAVSKRFEQTVALDAVSLEIGESEIFGLLGPNGAGKTTLIRTILDIIKPDSGRVDVLGHPFQPADRDRIAYLPEERGLYPRQEVRAVLEYLGTLKGMSPSSAHTEAARWL